MKLVIYHFKIESQQFGKILFFETRIDEKHLDTQVQLEIIKYPHDKSNERLELVGNYVGSQLMHAVRAHYGPVAAVRSQIRRRVVMR